MIKSKKMYSKSFVQAQAADALKFVNSCDLMNKKLWMLMDDYEINVPFEIPGLSEEYE